MADTIYGGGAQGTSAYEAYVEVQTDAGDPVLSKDDWVKSLVGPIGVDFDLDALAWDAGTTYAPRAGVTYAGSCWIALRATTNEPPDEEPDAWGLLVTGFDDTIITTLESYGAVGDGTTSDQTAWAAAKAAGNPIYLQNGKDYLVTDGSNTLGVSVSGEGRLITAVTGGHLQHNIPAFESPAQFRHHLWKVKKRIIASESLKIVIFGDSTATNDYGINIDSLVKDELENMGIGVEAVTQGAVAGTAWSSSNYGTILTGYGDQKHLLIIKFGINDAGSGDLDAAVATLRNAMRQRLAEIRASAYGGLDDLSILLIMPNALGNTATNSNNRNNLWLEAIRGVYWQAAKDYACALYDPYIESRWAEGQVDRALDSYLVHPQPNYNLDIWGRALREMLQMHGNVPRNRHVIRTNADGGFPDAADGLTAYRRGETWERCFTADGWPIGGMLVTRRQTDGIGVQEIFDYAAEHPQHVERHWITGSSAWSEWSGIDNVFEVRDSADGSFPVPATALTSYPNGVKWERCLVADGWPIGGYLITERHPDNLGRQALIDYTSTYPRGSTRRWITGSGWSDWTGSTGAQTLTLVNSWVAYGGTHGAPKVMRTQDGLVMLSGAMKDGTTTAGTTLFTLPSGFRPPAALILTGTILASPYQTTLDVTSAGVVSLRVAGPATGLWLDGISFMGAV